MPSRRRPARALPIVLALSFLAAARATAAPPSPLRPAAAAADAATDAPWTAAPVGQFGGGIYAMAADAERGIVWAGVGPRVEAIDVSDPTAPTVVGRTEWLSAHVTALAVQGTTGVALTGWTSGAVLADTDHTVHVLDLSDPTAPRVVGGLAVAGAEARVALGHGHAYVIREAIDPSHDASTQRFELVAIDIRDPRRLRLVNDDVMSGAEDIVDVRVNGDLLAVTQRKALPNGYAGDHFRLHLLRLTDAAAPTPVRTIDDDAWCRLGDGPGADVAGMLYGYGYGGGIVALDVSAPTAPRAVRRWPAADVGPSACGPVDIAPFLVDAAGSPYLAVFNGINKPGDRLVNIGAPPDALGRRPAHDFVVGGQAAALIGSHAVVAEASGDITVVDIRAMTTADGTAGAVGGPRQLGWTGAIAVRDDVDDGMLYAALVTGGLTTLSLESPLGSPLDPPVAGRFVDGRERWSLHVAGGLAAIGRRMVADETGSSYIDEAEVIDFTDPTAPRPRAVFGGGRFARLMSTASGMALVHGRSGDSIAAPPLEISGLADPPTATSASIAIEMGLLDGDTVGERFVAVGSTRASWSARCTTKRLALWDGFDAGKPTLAGALDLEPCSSEPDRLVVAATDRFAFIGAALDQPEWPAIGRSRLTVVAIDDPSAPRVIAQLPLSGSVKSLTERDGYLFAGGTSCITQWRSCIGVIDARDPAAPRVIGTLDAAPGYGRDGVAVRGGRVYVVSAQMGIEVFEPPLDWWKPRPSGWRWLALPWVGVR